MRREQGRATISGRATNTWSRRSTTVWIFCFVVVLQLVSTLLIHNTHRGGESSENRFSSAMPTPVKGSSLPKVMGAGTEDELNGKASGEVAAQSTAAKSSAQSVPHDAGLRPFTKTDSSDALSSNLRAQRSPAPHAFGKWAEHEKVKDTEHQTTSSKASSHHAPRRNKSEKTPLKKETEKQRRIKSEAVSGKYR